MNKLIQKLSVRFEDVATPFVKNCQNLIEAHPELTSIGILIIACITFLFVGLDFYPLMDVDETRYAIMARDLINSFDYNSLMLNGMPFLEKPPLYFWLVGASIKLWGQFCEFAVRLPIALLATFLIFCTYYVGKKVISRKFGVVSALVLLTSIFFLILSHIAILDMVLTVFMTTAIYSAFLTNFCQEKNKKYYWWYFYVFIGLGFLAKGILALAIPLIIIFLYNLVTNNLKEIFKPINILPGILIFVLIAAPWHYAMYKQYGFQFIREYFLVHHFARLMGAEVLGRERPFWYFIPVFLLGFLPWSLSFVNFVYDGCKKLALRFNETEGKVWQKLSAMLDAQTNEQKLLLFGSIYFIVVFLLFSSSGTKLPTYILPVFPAASFLTGYFWWVADEKGEHEKGISIATNVFSAMFIFAAMAFTVAYFYLPYILQEKMESFQHITLVAIYLLSILLLLRLNTKRAMSIFFGYVFFMFFVIMLSVSNIFNLVYATGESELVNYSMISAQLSENSRLITFDFAVKPSVMIEYPKHVFFITDRQFDELDKKLDYQKGPVFVIVKNKNFEEDPKYYEELTKRMKIWQQGERYSLFVKDPKKELEYLFYQEEMPPLNF